MGNFLKRSTHSAKFPNSSALRWPCTSCTILPSIRSIEGISTEASREYFSSAKSFLDREYSAPQNGTRRRPALHRLGRLRTLPRRGRSIRRHLRRSRELPPTNSPLSSARNQSRDRCRPQPSTATKSLRL